MPQLVELDAAARCQNDAVNSEADPSRRSVIDSFKSLPFVPSDV